MRLFSSRFTNSANGASFRGRPLPNRAGEGALGLRYFLRLNNASCRAGIHVYNMPHARGWPQIRLFDPYQDLLALGIPGDATVHDCLRQELGLAYADRSAVLVNRNLLV